VLALLHRLFQFLLALGKQRVNLAVGVVADNVNLRTELLPRSGRILIEQRLNPVVVRRPRRRRGMVVVIPFSYRARLSATRDLAVKFDWIS
jgi:hypothetical protein